MRPEDYKLIIYEPGPITKIIHNEPDIRNPMTGNFILELKDALARFQRNREAKVGVLLAAGTVFCSGHNLRYVSKMESWERPKDDEKKGGTSVTEEEWRAQMDFMRDNLYYPLWDCKKPLVVGVQGACLGGGLNFVCAGDIVVASEDAFFDYSITRISGAGANLLVYYIGPRKAAEIELTGGKFTATDAANWGLVNKAVPREQLNAEVMRYANLMAQMPIASLKLAKSVYRTAMNRMGVRDVIWWLYEIDIIGHLEGNPRESVFYSLLKNEGMKAAVAYRDKPFQDIEKAYQEEIARLSKK